MFWECCAEHAAVPSVSILPELQGPDCYEIHRGEKKIFGLCYKFCNGIFNDKLYHYIKFLIPSGYILKKKDCNTIELLYNFIIFKRVSFTKYEDIQISFHSTFQR